MFAVLSQLVATSALVATPEFFVGLKGADSAACAAAVNAEACFVARSSVSISLEVRSSDGNSTIHSVRYGMFEFEKSAVIASGEQIDGKGQSIETIPLPFPHSKSTGCGYDQIVMQIPGRYVVQTYVGTGEDVRSRKLVLDILPDENFLPVARPVGSTRMKISPKGIWRDIPRHGAIPAALEIESCTMPGVRIVAFVVQPVPGVSLRQYVTHSIAAYSDNAMWHVRTREPSHIASTDAEHLSLEQTISGVSVNIEKYFVAVDTKIVILSIYGLPASEALDVATSIRIVEAGDRSPTPERVP